MNINELIKEEYKTVFGVEESIEVHSPDSYKKMTRVCSKKKIIQNSIEMYQSEQKLQRTVNNPFITNDDYIRHPVDCHLPEMSNSHIFRNLKKENFSKIKSLNHKKKDDYSEYIADKCCLLSLQAVEEDKINKALILYYSAKLLNNKINTPAKLFKILIQESKEIHDNN